MRSIYELDDLVISNYHAIIQCIKMLLFQANNAVDMFYHRTDDWLNSGRIRVV